MSEGDSHADAPPPKKKRTVVKVVLGVLLVAVIYTAWQAISIHRYGFRDGGRSADCAIVLGAAAWHNKPSPVFEERIKHAIKLYEDGRVRVLILTGGFGDGAKYAESEVARTFCLKRGIPEEALFIETKSQTTLENVAEARALLDEHGLTSALIVSDPWHLKRGVLMAKRAGIEAYPSGTPTTRFRSVKARSNFLFRELYFYHKYLIFGR